MPTGSSLPREYFVTTTLGGSFRHFHGPRLDGQIDSALKGRIQILEHGVAVWGLQREDSRTVIPWSQVQIIEEVF